MIKLGGEKGRMLSFHPDGNWFAVYANDTDMKPYICERLAGWALCEFGEDGAQLVGILPAVKNDYQFAADEADNFLGYMHANESAKKFDEARAEYLAKSRA